jgi:MFS family permease
VLRAPAAGLLLLSSVIGRLPEGMLGLAVVLLVRQAAGSFGPAGTVTAALLMGQAVGGIGQSRLIDRSRQTPLLVACGLLHPVALGVLTVGASRRAPAPLLAASALLAGLTAPQLTSCIRVVWSELLADELDRQAAFALDAVALEGIFLLGPVLVAGLVLLASPALALLVGAGLAGAGTLVFAATGPSRAWRGAARDRTAAVDRSVARTLAGPLRAAGIRTILLATMLFGVGDGFVQIAVTSYAVQWRRPSLAGALLAAMALGSVLGGGGEGRRRWPGQPHQRFLVLHALLAGGLALTAWSASPATLAPLLVLSGLAIAPIATEGGLLTSSAAPEGTVTEAFAWGVTAVVTGIVIGTAVAGQLAAAWGFRMTMLAAAAALACAALVIGLGGVGGSSGPGDQWNRGWR